MKLPDFFDRLFWSQDFSDLSPEEDRELIIIRAINYGKLEHWRWISRTYGKQEVGRILSEVPATRLREKVRPLASLLFEVEQFNHVQRSTE